MKRSKKNFVVIAIIAQVTFSTFIATCSINYYDKSDYVNDDIINDDNHETDTKYEFDFVNDDNYEIDTTKLPDFIGDLKLGWNLGNALDAQNNGVANETAWGNPKITQAIFNGVKQAGFDIVRIPVTWLGHIGDADSGYKIKEDYMSRVKEVVGYAKAAGLKVIINIHHDGADSNYWLNIKDACGVTISSDGDKKIFHNGSYNRKKDTAICNQLYSMWQQIAKAFPDSQDYLIFETMNEIHDGGWGWGENRQNPATKQYDILNEWNQICVRAIRYAGAKNYIACPGYVTNIDLTYEHFTVPKDKLKRVLLAVHYYDPNDFVLEGEKKTWNAAGSEYGGQNYMTSQFEKIKSKFASQVAGIYIGECGAVYTGDSSATSERQKYNVAVINTAKSQNILPIFWDNGSGESGKERSGLFNRSTGAVYSHCTNLVSAMTAAAQ